MRLPGTQGGEGGDSTTLAAKRNRKKVNWIREIGTRERT